MKKFIVYIEIFAEDEGNAFSQADEIVNKALNEESTIQNTFSIKES